MKGQVFMGIYIFLERVWSSYKILKGTCESEVSEPLFWTQQEEKVSKGKTSLVHNLASNL